MQSVDRITPENCAVMEFMSVCGYHKLQPPGLDLILEEQESASLGTRASGR